MKPQTKYAGRKARDDDINKRHKQTPETAKDAERKGQKPIQGDKKGQKAMQGDKRDIHNGIKTKREKAQIQRDWHQQTAERGTARRRDRSRRQEETIDCCICFAYLIRKAQRSERR